MSLKFIKLVLSKSLHQDIETARNEWCIVNTDEVKDKKDRPHCVCGNPGLRYLYTIRNMLTMEELDPIGSSCIEFIGNDEMTLQLKILEKGKKIFINEGKKHHGQTYKYIYENDQEYITFLKVFSNKKTYQKLIVYYDARKDVEQRRNEEKKQTKKSDRFLDSFF